MTFAESLAVFQCASEQLNAQGMLECSEGHSTCTCRIRAKNEFGCVLLCTRGHANGRRCRDCHLQPGPPDRRC